MKILLILIAFTSILLAEYEKGKIDMHGGKENYSSREKSSFQRGSMGFSNFLDTNSSKSTTPKEKKY